MIVFAHFGKICVFLVHGFERTEYTVQEGESVEITFKRNVKGETDHRRLSFQGNITSEGDEKGKCKL